MHSGNSDVSWVVVWGMRMPIMSHRPPVRLPALSRTQNCSLLPCFSSTNQGPSQEVWLSELVRELPIFSDPHHAIPEVFCRSLQSCLVGAGRSPHLMVLSHAGHSSYHVFAFVCECSLENESKYMFVRGFLNKKILVTTNWETAFVMW